MLALIETIKCTCSFGYMRWLTCVYNMHYNKSILCIFSCRVSVKSYHVIVIIMTSHPVAPSIVYVAWSSCLVFTCRKVSLLVCKRLTLIIKMLTFLGDIRMFISALRHAVRDKRGKYIQTCWAGLPQRHRSCAVSWL